MGGGWGLSMGLVPQKRLVEALKYANQADGLASGNCPNQSCLSICEHICLGFAEFREDGRGGVSAGHAAVAMLRDVVGESLTAGARTLSALYWLGCWVLLRAFLTYLSVYSVNTSIFVGE